MRVYQKYAGDDAKLLIKFHWPYAHYYASIIGGSLITTEIEKNNKETKTVYISHHVP